MQYLIIPTYAEATALDQQVMQRLRETDGAKGSSWSGVSTDGTRFAILWDSPVAAVYPDAVPEEDSGQWLPYTPPQPEEPTL